MIGVLFTASVAAQGPAMPDPKDIAGIPLPVGDVAAGTVTVRVVKGSLANNLAGQTVDLVVDGTPRRQTTGESGRAEFTGLRPGARVKATAVVAGERLESQEFPVPMSGGVRVLLVATDPSVTQRESEDRQLAAGPARPGAVVLGEQTRFVFEMGDAALNVFSILQIVNTARTPVEPREPVVFEAASNGGAITMLEGSSPRAAVEDKRVVVAGPFPPGATIVQFAYSVPYSGPDVTVEQRFPIPLNRVTALAQKVGPMDVKSPQLSQQREMTAQGETYIVGQGPGVAAGTPVSFAFTGLPHAPRWPRNLAFGIAALILAGGAWASARTPAPASRAGSRARLEAERDRLYAELAPLERQRAAGSLDPAQASRRRDLLAQLESVYAALDN